MSLNQSEIDTCTLNPYETESMFYGTDKFDTQPDSLLGLTSNSINSEANPGINKDS